MTQPLPDTDLITQLAGILGAQRVSTELALRELMSADFNAAGATCAAVIRPEDARSLAAAARVITANGYALIPRGGGMTYTGGYTPQDEATVIVDLADLAGIVELNEQDMVVTVRAGTTWEVLYDELRPRGLRLPFFGTFSGRRATVGGGLSNGAVFFGTTRYGTAADHALGLEVVCADGRILRTGQAAFRSGKPFYRTQGPDLTGLFLHDCGAFGIKTEASLRLIEAPAATEYLSFALPDAASAAAALSAVARTGAAEEAYVFDPASTRKNLEGSSLADDLKRLGQIVGSQPSVLAGARAGARVIAAGKRMVPEGSYSLHVVCAGRSESATRADADICRQRAKACGGREIANSIPLAARAALFDSLNAALGSQGERWVALNAKLTHSDAPELIARFAELAARNAERLKAASVTISTLFIAMDTHAFSFEPVFHWPDRWLPMHREVPDAKYLQQLTEPPANPDAAALVEELRAETLRLFDEMGAASNQLGRVYPYRERLGPDAVALLDALKASVDPDGLMNPGVLGFPVKSRPG